VFTMDHQERNIRSFENLGKDQPPFLIADPRIQPAIVNKFFPHVYMASWRSTTEAVGEPMPLDSIPTPQKSGNAIYQWLQEKSDIKGNVYGPGSVAVVGFHILARMGCQPIILAGQDLAFAEGKDYAEGTIFDDKTLQRDAEAVHEVESVAGETVKTSDTLNLYRKLLEHEIKRFGIPVFNTSSGALIKGSISSRIENILNELPRESVNIQKKLSELHSQYKPASSAARMQNILKSGIADLEAFTQTAREGLAQAPPDYADSLEIEAKQTLLASLEKTVAKCSNEHTHAMDLLNELLQGIHFEFEEKRWAFFVEKDKSAIIDVKIYAHTRVLDSFVRQANFLFSLIEETIARLD